MRLYPLAKSRVLLSPSFGEPVVCSPDSQDFCHVRSFRDARESSTQLLVCSCQSWGACLGRTATQRSKNGSEKVLGRVLEKGSQKGSEKWSFYGFYSREGF